MDPLSPSDDINAGWSSPTDHTSPLPPSPAPPTTASSSGFSSAASSSAAGLREPKIFGAPGMGLVSPPPDAQFDHAKTNGAKEPPRPYLRVRIGTLERNRKDLLVRFDASTNLQHYRLPLYKNMQRSYVEFQKFAEQVQLLCPQTIIPALPLPSTSAMTDEEDDRLVRIALQRWFSRVCEDLVLMKEHELRSFIEAEFSYNPITPQNARRAGSSTVLSALTKVVRRGPLDEDDELASAKIALEKLEERYAQAATCVNQLGKARRQLAQSNADVGARMISLSTVESEPSLAGAERKMGRTWEHGSGLMGSQAAHENVILSDSIGYQALNARAAKDTLTQRTLVLEDAQAATKSAINKRRALERLKGSSNINQNKVDDAISEMQEADALEDTLSKRVSAISENLHTSLRAHSRHAHEDIAISLLEAARMSVMYHKQTLKELESLKVDVGKVAPGAAPLPVEKRTAAGQTQVPARVPPMVRPPPPPQQQASFQGVRSPPAQVQAVQPAQAQTLAQGQYPRGVPTSQQAGPSQPPFGAGYPRHANPYQNQPVSPFHSQPSPSPYHTQAAPSPYHTHPHPSPQYQTQGAQSPYANQPQFQIPPPQNTVPQQSYYPQTGPPPPQIPVGVPTSPPRANLVPDGSQTMFLPPNGGGGIQRPHSAAPYAPYSNGDGGADPLGGGGFRPPPPPPGGHLPPGHVQGFPQGQMGMAQSMFVPGHPGAGQPGYPGPPGAPGTPGVYGPGPQRAGSMGRKRLDERKAAKLLAGGF
ncbi:hypothetical protein L202_07306 [Cryptococcus amylolentus CBS 6039]|uniref:PX domain-containing protein n=2 Tax=Cryptococcus amylolentus TaxID=104669 RepID=A0A1E3HBQ9_9TREE|nr:hypothetical protein L202_07306 [Cryptococcus amylolentus CBS 6039]ODN73778.1 hypothetical protein L202_07306 [Cryptococcus amylolentus CBS 6039]ODO00352.1 hypothetical protein I350_06988 [Cryptococcus amylolentus CBS 6273]